MSAAHSSGHVAGSSRRAGCTLPDDETVVIGAAHRANHRAIVEAWKLLKACQQLGRAVRLGGDDAAALASDQDPEHVVHEGACVGGDDADLTQVVPPDLLGAAVAHRAYDAL